MNNYPVKFKLIAYVQEVIKANKVLSNKVGKLYKGWFGIVINGVDFDIAISIQTESDKNTVDTVYNATAYLVVDSNDSNDVGKVTDMSIEINLGSFVA